MHSDVEPSKSDHHNPDTITEGVMLRHNRIDGTGRLDVRTHEVSRLGTERVVRPVTILDGTPYIE